MARRVNMRRRGAERAAGAARKMRAARACGRTPNARGTPAAREHRREAAPQARPPHVEPAAPWAFALRGGA
jgi:hypothetical protein